MSPMQPPQGIPQAPQGNPGQQQINPEMMQMLMQMLTNMPDVPAGGMPTSSPSGSIPQMAKMPTGTEQMMSMMVGQMNAQNPQSLLNGAMGGLGAVGGNMGGRPRGM